MILVSGNPQRVASKIWNHEEPLAIRGDFRDGLDRLTAFLQALRIEQPDAHDLHEEIDATIEHFKDKSFQYFWLEAAEIFALTSDAFSMEEQASDLFGDVQHLQKLIDRILDPADPTTLSGTKDYFINQALSNWEESLGLYWTDITYFTMKSEAPYPALLGDYRKWMEAPAEDRQTVMSEVAQEIAARFTYHGLKTFSCTGQSFDVGLFDDTVTGMRFHLVPGGTFLMGNTDGEQSLIQDSGFHQDLSEYPGHDVYIPPFLIAPFFITEKIWYDGSGIDLHWKFGDLHPVDAIDHVQAKAWCAKNGLRLPSDSEWEFACRAGSRGIYYWGNDPDRSYVWMRADMPQDDYINHTEQEHDDKRNAIGLVDMLGHLDDWVMDDAHDWDAHPPSATPYISGRLTNGIPRGGSINSEWQFCRCSSRTAAASDWGDTGASARAAISIEDAMKPFSQATTKKEEPTPIPPTEPEVIPQPTVYAAPGLSEDLTKYLDKKKRKEAQQKG